MDIYACAPANLPIDAIAPRLRKGVTQVGYGGPFVLRGNPIGGLIDTIRGFCFPVPMEQMDSGLYGDLSGSGLDSAGISGGTGDFAGLGAGMDSSGNTNSSLPSGNPAVMMCGPGQAFDTVSMTCQPSGMTDAMNTLNAPIPGGPEDLMKAQDKVIAFQMGQGSAAECYTFIQTMQLYRPIAPSYLRGQWTDLINASKAVCANAKKRKAAPSQTVSALSAGPSRANLGRMPMVATPLSLTEGNVQLQPSREPMAGMIDPRAMQAPRGPATRASRRPSLLSRVMGR